MEAFFWVILLLPLVVAVGLPIMLGLRRRRRFAGRSVLSFGEWCVQYHKEDYAANPVVENVLQALAKAIGVEATQFSPADRFDVEIAFAPRWVGLLRNHAIEEFLDEVAKIVWDQGVKNWKRFPTRGQTLGDLLDEVHRAVSEEKGISPKDS